MLNTSSKMKHDRAYLLSLEGNHYGQTGIEKEAASKAVSLCKERNETQPLQLGLQVQRFPRARGELGPGWVLGFIKTV